MNSRLRSIVRNIRVLLATQATGVRDTIEELIHRESGVKLVGEVSHAVDVLLAVKRTRADVVVVGREDSGKPGLNTHLLAEYPHLIILGMAGQTVFVEQLCPRRLEIVTPSGPNILATLRRAIRLPCGS
jgi:DNA-binding NarL/FixJ family response regulator